MKPIITWSLIVLRLSFFSAPPPQPPLPEPEPRPAPAETAAASGAATRPYKLDWSAGSSLGIRVPYTVGTHNVSVQAMRGSVMLEPNGKVTGRFSIPLTSLDTGSGTRDCHMREGLGLDYTKSKYPDEHICNSDNALDETQIVYPNIEFELEKTSPLVEWAKLRSDAQNFQILGKWSIHGVTKEVTFPAAISLTGENKKQILLDTTIPIHLKDFGIVIKKAFIISVSDEISAHLHLIFTSEVAGTGQEAAPQAAPSQGPKPNLPQGR